jgi:hypothetical protein
MMNGQEKSDFGTVAAKPTNKAGRPAAEPVEPRPGTEGNAGQQSTHRAQNRARVTQALDRVRHAASPVRRQTPKVGATCGKAARVDLCGGRSATGVPTAIQVPPLEFTLEGRGHPVSWSCRSFPSQRVLPMALEQREALGRPCVPGMGTGLEVKVLRGARW